MQTEGAKGLVHGMDGGCVLFILNDETGTYTGSKTVYMAGWRGAYQLVPPHPAHALSLGGGFC